MSSSNASAERRSRARVSALFVVLALTSSALPARAPAQPGEAAPPTVDALLAGLRSMPGLEASFEEERHVALLAAPLTSRGRLFFAPPSTLLRRVEHPQRGEVLIHGTELRIRQGGQEEVMDLRSRREVRPLVESMLWIFRGDRAALERVYRLTYVRREGADAGRFRLTLVPRTAPLDKLISELVIEGQGRAVTRIEMREPSGDRTVTRIVRADPRRRFSAAERARLFRTAAR